MKSYKTMFIGLFCLLSGNSFAQYNTLSEWYFGPSAGMSMSTITLLPKMVDKLYNNGIGAGVTARYISEKKFGVQLEVNYLESGWKEDLNGLKKSSDYSYSRSLKFVEIPLLMHVYSGKKANRFFLNVGPDFSYLLSEKETLRDFTTQNNMPQHGKAIEHPFQYGFVGGGGFELHLKRSVIGFEGRYHFGLSNLFDDTISSNNFSTSSLQTIGVNLYYLVRL